MKLKTLKRAFVPVLLACVLVITPSCSPSSGGTDDPIDKYIGSYSLNDDDGKIAEEVIEESTKQLADVLTEGSSIEGVQIKIEIIKVDADTANLNIITDFQVTGTTQMEGTSKVTQISQLKVVEGDQLEGTKTTEDGTITTTVTTTVTLDGNVLNMEQVIKTVDSGTTTETTLPVRVFTKI